MLLAVIFFLLIILLILFLVVFLIFVNIGLNISGPVRYEMKKDEAVLAVVQERFPLIHSLYRHSFKYVTYSAVNDDTAYLFDNEGGLVMQKDYDVSMIEDIQSLVEENYGIENAEVNIGYGYDNMVFAVEEGDLMVYYDYDTYEVVYYLRRNLI